MQFKLNPGKTKAGLAQMLGLEPPAVSKILNGTRQVKAREYTLMRRYFGLPVDGEGAVEARLMHVSAGSPDLEDGLHEGQSVFYDPSPVYTGTADSVAQSGHSAGRYDIFRVRGHAMEPDFSKGESVLLDLSDTIPSVAGIFVISDGFEPMIRHCAFIPDSDPPIVKISARSNAFQPQMLSLSEFRIVGRVVGKVKWV
ncbi:MAG: S24 family peptidase [Alphaproteobacteria bacterium]